MHGDPDCPWRPISNKSLTPLEQKLKKVKEILVVDKDIDISKLSNNQQKLVFVGPRPKGRYDLAK